MSIDHSIEQARTDDAEFLAIKQAIARCMVRSGLGEYSKWTSRVQ